MDGNDVRRRAAEHSPRVLADFEHAAGLAIHRHDRRLTQADAASGDIKNGRIGTEVNGNIFFDNGGQNRHSQFPFKSD